ncbi:MAG: endolytic transglycosylase MltG [Saprospiraceae bacterium]|nr:endolytic transglycosylase MltG [Saprospiraceae bacterium]
MKKGNFKRIAVLLLVVFTILAWWTYHRYLTGARVPADLKEYVVQIPTGSSFQEVATLLEEKGILKEPKLFEVLAERMNYIKSPMRAGQYEVKPGWNTVQLIRHLRGGKQAPVKVVLTTERMTENVAAKVARFIEADSLEIWQLFQNKDYLQEIGYTEETLMSLFIPNTYEVFWNTSPKSFMDRMIKEHERFWKQKSRLAKAKAIGLEPWEVYTLASIVEKETYKNQEKPKMAGVYLNRLEQDILLQADPTSVFARRDFNTRRVTNYHTKFDSPYNTYKYKGLPPGPIAMSSINSIDAVLEAEDHEYLFFCAKGDGSGLHNFAKTLSAHNQNAATYRANLRKRGLR